MPAPSASRNALPDRGRLLVVFALVFAGLSLPRRSLAAEWRTFTDTTGRTIVAEIMEASDDTVRVRREDGRVFAIALENLSADDRTFVEAWRHRRAFAMGGLEVTTHRVRLDSDRKQIRPRTRKTENWCYKVTIANHSQADLSGLTIEYRVFYVADSAKAEHDELPLERKRGRATLRRLAAGADAEVQTTGVALQIIQLKPGYRYIGTSKRRVEDKLAGIWVRVLRNGEILREFADPSTLVASEPW